jgi:Kef-type K+ transport system membrane component KefB
LEFFAAVFLMLAVATLFGELVRRAKLPSLVGELLAGMLLGTAVLNLIEPTSDLTTTTNVSLFFIMFLTGLSINSRDIVSVGRRAILLSLPGFIVPLLLGTGVASVYGLGLRDSLAIGLALSITAVPVNSIILMDLGIMKSRLGNTVLTAGVIDDQISVVLLGVILQLPASSSAVSPDYTSLLVSIGEVLVFTGGVFFVDWLLREDSAWISSVLGRLHSRLLVRESGIGLLVIFGLGVSLLAEAMGLHFIIGAFFAGMLLNQAVGESELKRPFDVLSGMTFGIFAPLLFVYIGIQLNPSAVEGVLPFFVVLLSVAVAGKLTGGYIGARLGGYSAADSRLIGVLLNSRGMVELVIASVIYQAGLIDIALFSVIVAVGVITTTMSAVLARATLVQGPETIEANGGGRLVLRA